MAKAKRGIERQELWALIPTDQKQAIVERFNVHCERVKRDGPTNAIEKKILKTEKDFNQFKVNYFRKVKERAAKKIDRKPLKSVSLTLDIHYPSNCRVSIEGREYEMPIGGAVALIGTITYQDGTRTSIYPRFIGKTFWQCSYMDLAKKKQ